MPDKEQRAHDFAMAIVQDKLSRDEKCDLVDLIGEYNIAYTEMLDELESQGTQE